MLPNTCSLLALVPALPENFDLQLVVVVMRGGCLQPHDAGRGVREGQLVGELPSEVALAWGCRGS